jgi:hypothetical protein
MPIDGKWEYQVRQDAHQAVLEGDYKTAVALYLSIQDGASASAAATLQLAKVSESIY